MQTKYKWSFLLPLAVASSIVMAHGADAPADPGKGAVPNVGDVPVGEILKQLGAKMEGGVSSEQLDGYSRHFDRVDLDRDGLHSKVEYIEKAKYMTPQARRGIFGAADNDGDGSVSKSEYILNRIITDEGKTIMQAMDDDKDGAIQAAEFERNAVEKLGGKMLAGQVFVAFDTDKNGAIRVPEYLRVWGKWARAGQEPAAQRIAARELEISKAAKDDGGGGAPAAAAPGTDRHSPCLSYDTLVVRAPVAQRFSTSKPLR